MNLIALYQQPENPSAFDEAYFNTHVPLIKKVPGLKDITITRFTRTIMGDGLYMMAVMHFEDEDYLKTAMKSPEMGEAGKNLNSFASGLATLMFGEVVSS